MNFGWLKKKKTWQIVEAVFICTLVLVTVFAFWRMDYEFQKSHGGGHYELDPNLLAKFQTFTVEIENIHPLLDRYPEYSSAISCEGIDLARFALDDLSEKARDEFGPKILSSKYGQPYSYKTNPLNLSIKFSISQYRGSKTFMVSVNIERSKFFRKFYYARNDPAKLANPELLIRQISGPFERGVTGYLPSSGIGVTDFVDCKGLQKKIKSLSTRLVELMNPEAELAAELENKLYKKAE